VKDKEESVYILKVSELNGGRGEIIYNEDKAISRKRAFWVMEETGTVVFTLNTNRLIDGYIFTVTGFLASGEIGNEFFVK